MDSSAILGPMWGSRVPSPRQLGALEGHLRAFEDRLQATKASNSQRERPDAGKCYKSIGFLIVFDLFIFLESWFPKPDTKTMDTMLMR